MTDPTTLYEIFISHARKDNRPIPETCPHGWVTGLRDHILAAMVKAGLHVSPRDRRF